MKNLILAVLTLVFSGCAGPQFIRYDGPQKDWPTAEGSFVTRIRGIDLYPKGYVPSRPYELVGQVVGFSDAQLARVARQHGGDALIIRAGQVFHSPTVTPGHTEISQFKDFTSIESEPTTVSDRTDAVLGAYIVRYRHTTASAPDFATLKPDLK